MTRRALVLTVDLHHMSWSRNAQVRAGAMEEEVETSVGRFRKVLCQKIEGLDRSLMTDGGLDTEERALREDNAAVLRRAVGLLAATDSEACTAAARVIHAIVTGSSTKGLWETAPDQFIELFLDLGSLK